jgi:hypothetical protein
MQTSLKLGPVVHAVYHDEFVEEYRGNPWIEGLPRVASRADAKSRMAFYPQYDPHDRLADPEDREDAASAKLELVRHPLSVHVELHARISKLIRQGYIGRNPALPGFQADVEAMQDKLRERLAGADAILRGGYDDLRAEPCPSAAGLSLIGVTGIGKSKMVEMALGLYPSVIVHSEYAGRPLMRTQVLSLTLTCTKDGSIKSLCNNFFLQLDDALSFLPHPPNYLREYTRGRPSIDDLVPRLAGLAAQHGLGILVIDEVQDLNPRGSRAILSFLVHLVNTIGVPLLLVGGNDAQPILQAQFRQARRSTTEGAMILERASKSREWRELCETLWRYQYTKHETPLTDALVDELYRLSQGITQWVVTGIKLAQSRAIATGLERITPALLRSVFADSIDPAAPMLVALRNGDEADLRGRTDVRLDPDLSRLAIPFAAADPEDRSLVPPSEPANATGSGPVPEEVPQRPKRPIKRSSREVAADRLPSRPTLVALGATAQAEGKSAHAMFRAHALTARPLHLGLAAVLSQQPEPESDQGERASA